MRRTLYISLAVVLIGATSISCRRGASSNDETPDTSTYRPLPTPATEFEFEFTVELLEEHAATIDTVKRHKQMRFFDINKI